MIRRLLTRQSKSITGAAVILGAASFVSRIMGIARDRIFAHQFGVGDVLDAYYAAFRIPDFIFNILIVGAIAAGFIPVFTKLIEKNNKEAWRVANSILNLFGLALTIASAVIWVLAPQIMQYIVPGFEGVKLADTILLTRIMLLSPILLGVSSIIGSILQSFKSFLVYSLTPIMYNAGIIFGAIALVPMFGIAGLAYGVVIGAALHLLIQLPALFHHGFRYQPLLAWRNSNVRRIIVLVIPRTLGLAAGQVNLIAITVIASTISAGSIAVFNFANNLQYFPIGIIGVSFAVAAFPTLATLIAKGKKEAFTMHLVSTIKQILFLIIPFTVLFLLLRAQIVRIVLGTGAFTWEATVLTADALAYFALSLFAQSLILLFVRVFYVFEDTLTPFLVSILAVVVNIVGSLYFKEALGVIGLALAFSLAAVFQLAVLWLLLRIKIGPMREGDILKTLAKLSIAAIIMAPVVQMLKIPIASIVDMSRFWGIFTQGAISSIAGITVYASICHLLEVEEMSLVWHAVKRRIKK